ncbi:TldD/PmbA family protein, partial [candidate division WOR-3 bacterium]|nr:TldD/PmbA family protein [candidate division WOR-3 bacterium]
MFEKLESIISKVNVEYADIRYEKKKDTKIVFNGKELTQIGSNSTDGYVLRVLKKGGFSSVAFTKEKDAEEAVLEAVRNAMLISENIEEPVVLTEAEVIKDTFIPILEEDPQDVSIDEKLEIT